jgi:3-methyladenine DNA glycosylase AlkC
MKFKDVFNERSVGALADAIKEAYPALDREAFLAGVLDEGWPDLELKQRMRKISTTLGGFVPTDFRRCLEILRRALPWLTDYGFVLAVFPDFVEVFGLDDWEASMAALEEFTQVMSAEYAIRPFIVRYPERTMAQMLAWARHENAEVRRLASEGCRPRLPWGMALDALKADPSPILPVLESLKLDESESVRRSVANNLNDISKDNPDVVLEVLRRWQADDEEELGWITRHALRTLLKSGHPEALDLLGFCREPAIGVANLTVEPKVVPMGGEVTFSFEVESLSDRPQELMIDYVVYYVKASGQCSPKVWKLSKRTLQPGQILRITRRHSFAPVTTRKYYPGELAVEPKINGRLFGRVPFVLGRANP